MYRTIAAAAPLLLLLLGAGCAAMPACPARGGRPWTQVRSPHFTLRSDMPRAQAERLVVVLEETRAAMVAIGWPGEPAPPGQISVIALDSHAAVSEFTDRNIVSASIHRSPFPSTVVVATPTDDEGLRGIVHGLAYSLIHWFTPLAPLWYREGLASYLESVRYDHTKGAATVATDTLVRYHDLLRLSPLKTRDILSTDVPPTRVALSRFQSSSWLLVQYLLDLRTADFRTLQRRLRYLENPRSVWSSVFDGQSMKEWDDQLYRYGGRGHFSARAVELQVPAPQIQSTTMSDAEVHGARAFLYGVVAEGRRRSAPRRAREEVAEALRQQPGSLEALAVKFYSIRDADAADAEEVAREAVDLFPRQWLAWVLLADAVGLTAPEAQNAMQDALALAPDEPEVLARLAVIRAAHAQWGESVKFSSRALALGASHLALFRSHAVASALTGDCVAADRYAQVVIRQEKSEDQASKLSTQWPDLRARCKATKAAADQPPAPAPPPPAAEPPPEPAQPAQPKQPAQPED